MNTDIRALLRSIPGAERWRSCEPLLAGWSSDKKYRVTDARGNHCLLRTAVDEQYERMRSEFEHLHRVSRLDLIASRPLAFGRFEGGVYQLLSWVEGIVLEQALQSVSPREQYELGLEAGRTLARLHTLPAPPGTPDWAEYMNRKMNRKIERCLQCPLEVPGRTQMIEFMNDRRSLLIGRPSVCQHGDYHCGNMVLTPEGQVGVIDFNRIDAGDPWEEFNRIVWCAQCSPAFASGRINGYFDCPIPQDFFELTAAYIFSNQLSALPWAIPFGQKKIDTILNQTREVLSWYHNARCVVPSWYLAPAQAATLP